MRIIFLEDSIYQEAYLKKLSIKLGERFSIREKNIVITSKVEEVIDCAKQHIGRTLFFLDLEIYDDPMYGYKVAREIRKFDIFSNIVIITSHNELMDLAFDYKISAIDFIDKKILRIEDKIFENVAIFQEKLRLNSSSPVLTIDNKFEFFKIPISEIFYIETSHVPHKLHLVGEHQDINFYGKLKNILLVDPLFVQTHKSNVVNVANIQQVDKKNRRIIFRNGIETNLISRCYFNQLVESLN